MVHFQWPIKRGKRKPSGLEEGLSNEMLRSEAGLRQIQNEEDLANRVRFEDECNVAIINNILDQLRLLMHKKDKTAEDFALIDKFNSWLVSWEQYRATRKVAVAWSIAGEDRDMSKRYAAYETYFSRRWQNDGEAKKILRFSSYLRDISFRDKHVEPAPRIIVQTIPQQQKYVPLGVEDFATKSKNSISSGRE